MLSRFFVSLFFLFLLNFAYSEEPNWQVLPISGGKVYSLAHAPDQSGYLLASGAQRVFKTNDGGSNWSAVLSSVKPVAIAFSTNTNGLAYLSGSYANAFYKTTNYGQNWVLVSSATIEELMSTKSNFKFDVALAVDPLNENIIYGASNEVFLPTGGDEYPAILKTTNGGIDWSVMTASVFAEGVSTDAVITAFVQPASGNLIFSVNNGYGQNGGIFYSNDSGSSWHSAMLSVVDSSARAINCLAIDPSNPGTIYAGGKVILKSTDYGQTWTPLSSYPSYPSWDSIYEIAVISTNRIIACDSNKCYESTDDGSNWGPGVAIDNTTSSSIRGPLLYSSLDNAIYIAGGYSAGGIYKADTNSSLTGFTPVNNGLYNVEFLTLLHDPVNTNVIYGANQGDIFVSVDSGTSWSTTYPTSDGKRSGAFAMITDTDGTIYAGIGKVLRKSSDFGKNWTDVHDFSSLNIGNIMALAFDPNNHDIMYMGAGGTETPSADAGFYKSINKGQSWTRISLKDNTTGGEVVTVSRIAVSTNDANIIYAVCNPVDNENAYLYKTTDGGANWTKLSKPAEGEGGYIYSLALDPDYDGTVYVANDWYVYKSADYGSTWTAIFDDQLKGSVKSFIITHKPGKVRALYMGLDNSVYMSTDEATTWTLIGSGFNGVKALAEGSLYVGTSDGLYKADIQLPLEPLTSPDIESNDSDPLGMTFKATDQSNVIGSTYVVQVAASSDFSTIIYSTAILNTGGANTKTLLTLNNLNLGRTYYFRAAIVNDGQSSAYVSESHSYGTEANHSSEMGIGKWNPIKNHIVPNSPYGDLDFSMIDSGNNSSIHLISYHNYETDEVSIKAVKYDSSGTKSFEKDIISGIKYEMDGDNGFDAVSDGNNGFFIAWSSYSNTGDNYAFIGRFDSNANKLWSKNITGGDLPVYGHSDLKVLGDKAFLLYADTSGKVYSNSFDSNGNINNLDFEYTASQDMIVSVTTTSDNSIIVFYGTSGNLNAKKITYSNTITATGGPYSLISNVYEDNFAIPDNNGGAYFAYVDTLDKELKVFRVDSNLSVISGYPNTVDEISQQLWGGYLFDVGYSPNGPVFAYGGDSSSKVTFWDNASDSAIKTNTYPVTFDILKVSYNKNHNLIGVAAKKNNNGKDDIYISEYDLNGNEIIPPLKGASNLYGFSIQGENFQRKLVLDTVSDFFMFGYVSPENEYIQQISTYATLNIPTGLHATTVDKNSISISWTENNLGVTDWFVRYSTDSNFNVSVTTEGKITNNPYTANSLFPNTTYYFQVKSSSGIFESGYSTVFGTSTLVNIPTGLIAKSQSRTSTSLTFDWDSNSNSPGTKYNIVLLDGSNTEINSSTVSALSNTFTNLLPNTTYYAKVRAIGNNNGDVSDYTDSVSTKTLISISDISNVVFSNVLANSIKISFTHPSGAKSYEIGASSVSGFGVTDVIVTSSTVNTYATFGNGGEGTLIPNTTYYFRVKAHFDDEQTGYAELGSTVTLANKPTGFNFVDVYVSSLSFVWNANGNPDGTKYKIRYRKEGDTQDIAVIYSTELNKIITGLKGSTTYQFYISAINSSGIFTDEVNISTVTNVALETVETIGTGGGSVSFDSGSGDVKVNIPPSSFDTNITITVKLPDTLPSATKSFMGDISVKNIFVEVNTGGIQPKKPVEIVMDYSSLGSIDEDKLVIARYDDLRGVWIPLKSYVDKTNKKIIAYTDHFSVFGILSVTPASNISDPKVAPNPLRPSKGAGYTSMTFSNLPANVEVIIYSVSGVKIKKLTTDSSGIALWDGKNEDGKSVASGVYFALIKKGSSTKTIKIGVQR